MSDSGRAGLLFVISAPSGAGKTTVARRLMDSIGDAGFSISYTTRSPREGERDGVEYHFVGQDRFETMVAEGAFLEWAKVHGNCYGTGLEATRKVLESGRDLLLDIDVQGAGQVRGGPLDAVTVMILPPDFTTLESRLRGRASESEAELDRRLRVALKESEDYPEFDYVVINDRLDETVRLVGAILSAERSRARRSHHRVRRVLSTFPDRQRTEE